MPTAPVPSSLPPAVPEVAEASARGRARSRAALAQLQQGQAEQAELKLRALVRRYPLLAEAHTALASVLCSRGAIAEARACWHAATRIDPRCRRLGWLLDACQWPPLAIAALEPLAALDD